MAYSLNRTWVGALRKKPVLAKILESKKKCLIFLLYSGVPQANREGGSQPKRGREEKSRGEEGRK